MLPGVKCERSEGVKDELKITGSDIETVGMCTHIYTHLK